MDEFESIARRPSGLPGAVLSATRAYGELMLTGGSLANRRCADYLRDDPACLFFSFIDLTAADYPEREQRSGRLSFALAQAHHRVRVRFRTDEATPVPRRLPCFRACDWYEREVYDFFGVLFEGHPDLRASSRLRLRRPSATQGFPDDGLRRGALRRRKRSASLRAGEAQQDSVSSDF